MSSPQLREQRHQQQDQQLQQRLQQQAQFHTLLVLQDCCQLVNFFYSKVYQLFCNSFDICHFI